MAKTTAPLLSFGALGTIAKTAVFSKWKGRPYVRQHVIPANPQTAAQSATRNVFATASSIWTVAPSLFTAPWDRFAAGQVLTGRNAWMGNFTANLRGDADMNDIIMSPGAKGGLPLTSMLITPAALQLTVDMTEPALPTGWTITRAVAAIIEDGDPAAPPSFQISALEDLATPFQAIFTGLAAATTYQVGGWLEWLKPDGSVAYGPSLQQQGTTP